MNAVTVRIPPLRERGGDALLLASYFLNRFNREFEPQHPRLHRGRGRRRSTRMTGRAMCASWRTG